MQHLKKILRLSAIQIWTKIESFIYQNFWKNWSLWFSPQKMCKFLSNSVRFLDNHSRNAKNNSFTLSLTSFWKKSRIFRFLGGSCEKWQPISQQMGGFHVESTHFRITLFWPTNFYFTSTISIPNESCNVYLSFGILVRSLRPLVWPRRPRKVTNGKGRKIVENHTWKF